jgi:type III restriction enzyme
MSSFSLKEYQTRALHALSEFFRQARGMGIAPAWAHAMAREKMPAIAYKADELGDIPSVCLRIPTGGGKTLMASHAIVRIARTWANVEFPVALWLTPSDMIRSQTLTALQNPNHPYAAALRDAYGDLYRVISVDELATVAPEDFGRVAIIIVATIQTFRIEKKSDRRVYSFNEAFETHFRFLNVDPVVAKQNGLSVVEQADLDEAKQSFLKSSDLGRVKTSAANLLALLRPIVIVDEAHNAKTPKSLDMLRTIQPCAVLDLTATPVPKKTNVLYSVGARELEAEEMIKLPILLAEHAPNRWADAVRDAVLRRHALEREAADETDYVRPIVLFQAQDKGGDVTVEVLKKHLKENEKIPEYEIAVATGTQRELTDLNLLSPSEQIRYIITVDALREGWDCPFAYVLCSLQNLRSNTAVEQLLGRVLRMPYAKKRKSRALNRAYAQVVAKSFTDAAGALVDKLVDGMGFNPVDAQHVLLPDFADFFADTSDAAQAERSNAGRFQMEVSASAAQKLSQHPDFLIEADPKDATRAIVSVALEISTSMAVALVEVADTKPASEVKRDIDAHNARLYAMRSSSQRGELFGAIPLLCVRQNDELQLLEPEVFRVLAGFDLLASDPQPKLEGFAVAQEGEQFEIYLNDTKINMRTSNETQLSLNAVPTQATEHDLVRAISRQVRSIHVVPAHIQAWVSRIVAYLIREKGYPLTALVRAEFQLVQSILLRFEALERKSQESGFRQLMIDGLADAKIEVSPEWLFHFKPGEYPARSAYVGSFTFSKHYHPLPADLKSSGEEFECAKLIDRHPRVRCWIRNIPRTQFSFWLPTATDKFYPDFVAALVDGSFAVIEYKGEDYSTNDDSREKRLVGERWAAVCSERFAMIEFTKNGVDMSSQLNELFG